MSPPKFVCSNFLSGNYVEIVYHFKGTSISRTVKWKRQSNLIKIQIRESKRLKPVTADFKFYESKFCTELKTGFDALPKPSSQPTKNVVKPFNLLLCSLNQQTGMLDAAQY